MTMNSTASVTTPLLDIRSLWRIPAGAADSRPRARLSKVLGIQSPEINDLSPTDFWQTWSSGTGPSESATAAADDTVVAIIGDLLRDKVEDKSLPWYASPFSLVTAVLISFRC